jgi:hypothetical protein
VCTPIFRILVLNPFWIFRISTSSKHRSCAVNNYTTPEKKALATEFCAYASSKAQSNKFFQNDAADGIAGPDPFRQSQLDINLWVEKGYQSSSVIEYFESITGALGSENAVIDIRFPISNDIYALLDKEVHSYLNATVSNTIPESERATAREEIGGRLKKEFNKMINDYNSEASARSTLLQQYQKLRNVYSVEVDMNYIGDSLRNYGYTIAVLQMVLAVGFGIWTYLHRSTPVIKASQPFFLIMLCVGVFTFSASIIPIVIDDEHSSVDACNKSCMSLPWLLSLGWSILFSALYAKLRRINLVVSNAQRFRSVKISEKDMMRSISVLFTCNLVLIALWNILDPIVWERRLISPTESFGFCTVGVRSNVTWKVIVVLLGILNGGVLIVANVEAYKARKIDTEYGESVYIGLIMLFFLQIVLVGVPLFFIVQSNLVARFFLTTSMVFIMSLTVLLLIFVPKFLIYRKRLREGREGTKKRSSNIRIGGLNGSRTNDSRTDVFQEAEKVVQARMLYEKTWIERIAALEAVLEEAGIDAKLHLRSSNIIGDDNAILPMEGDDRGILSTFVPMKKRSKSRILGSSRFSRISESSRFSQDIWSSKGGDVSSKGGNVSSKGGNVSRNSIEEESAHDEPVLPTRVTESMTEQNSSSHLFAQQNGSSHPQKS